VLVWNTVHIARIVDQLRAAGHEVKEEDLARVSPLAHAHVIPNGSYFQSPAGVPRPPSNPSWPEPKEPSRPKASQVNWQPISQMPLISSMIDTLLNDTCKHLDTLSKAKDRPHVLDDATIDRVEQVHTKQMEFVDIYTQQIGRWRTENHQPLNPESWTAWTSRTNSFAVSPAPASRDASEGSGHAGKRAEGRGQRAPVVIAGSGVQEIQGAIRLRTESIGQPKEYL
jgi:hypothetical protein